MWTPEERPRRQTMPWDAFTPSSYEARGRGRNRARGGN
jgi:hypothetical protein